jgi:hypothetical protein
MAVQGIFTSNQGIIGERAGDFSSAILRLYPTGTALMLALSSGMSKKGAADTVFNWYEDSHISGRSAISSGGTSTTLVVADGSTYVPGTILLVEETGEVVLVTGTSGNSLTVIRGMSGSTITSVNNTMFVYNIGNAREEASGLPVAVTQQGHPRSNYTQIFRNGWAISGTAKAIKFTTGDKMAKNKADCAMYHAEDMEKSMLWGRKHIGTLNGKQFRMQDGIVTQIEQYGGTVVSAASGGVPGQLSLVDFNDWVRKLFQKQVKGQPNERIAIGGDQVVAVINRCVQLDSTYNISAGESKVGISVWTVMTPFGTLKLMTHPLMNESPFWQKQLYGLHPGGIAKRVLRDTFHDDHDASGKRVNGKDADEGAITTEFGTEVGAAATMGILRNVSTAVKSPA